MKNFLKSFSGGKYIFLFLKTILTFAILTLVWPLASNAQILRISKNNQYLERTDGTPFLWLGDTAWELFHKLNREDASFYLENRADKGFTIILAVVLAELDGLRIPNAYGEIPLIEMDPTRPNERYFEHVDFIINEAERLGLLMGVLPTWGDKVTPAHGGGPIIFDEKNALIYGEFLGNRYKGKSIVWILGGDRDISHENEKLVWRAMAEGIKKGDGGIHLISYHPRGPGSSYKNLHNEQWLDFNMHQSSHAEKYHPVYEFGDILQKVEPRKPFLEAEPAYEDIPVRFWEYIDWNEPLRVPANVLKSDKTIHTTSYFANGYFNDHDVRVHGYWNFMSGACGYTYGNNAIWQMFEKGSGFAIPCLTDWREALNRPGAAQIKHMRYIFEEYSFAKLVPEQSIIKGENPKDSTHIRVSMAADQSFILAYLSVGQPVNLDLTKLKHRPIASWYNPRNGQFMPIGGVKIRRHHEFVPPSNGIGNDWLLVIEKKKDVLSKKK
jgi:hypothetical protein